MFNHITERHQVKVEHPVVLKIGERTLVISTVRLSQGLVEIELTSDPSNRRRSKTSSRTSSASSTTPSTFPRLKRSANCRWEPRATGSAFRSSANRLPATFSSTRGGMSSFVYAFSSI